MNKYTLMEFDSLDSTSDFLKENQTYFPHMTIIRADFQEKGRGQFDRVWQSNKCENLLFSILLKQIRVNRIDYLKQWIIETITYYIKSIGINVSFKEPNDLYIRNKKLAGILIETISKEDQFDIVIIGIGININQMDFKELNATSLKQETHQSYDIKQLFLELLDYLLDKYNDYFLL